MNILIIKTGALGDVVRTSFIAQALKDRYSQNKKTKIFWLTSKKAKPFFINNIYVDKVVTLEEKEILKKNYFGKIINLEEEQDICNFVKSLKFEKLIGAFINKKEELDYTSEADYWFNMSKISKLGKKQADILKKKNTKTHRQIISEMIGIKNYEKYEPFIRLTKKQRLISTNFLRRYNLSRRDLIIGLNVGSADRWPKKLSFTKTVQLIDKLHKKFNAKILLFGGPEEVFRNREIVASSRAHIIDTGCGNNLFEFPALISLCNLFVTTDTLGLHVALALKRKTICLIGPTSPNEIDMYGFGEKVIAKSKCICCYKQNCKSMEKIDLSEIIEKTRKILKQKITILITAFKEPNISKTIEHALNQYTQFEYEILLSIPDKETLSIAKKYAQKNKNLKFFEDPGKGKSFALNLALQKIDTDVLILTDGDVYLDNNIVEEIVNHFKDPEVGVVGGRPFPIENKSTKFGYWAHFLFNAAHRIRMNAFNSNSFIECSGYLFAFRKKAIRNIPIDVAEDTVIPYLFWQKGYKIAYAENAKVYVKNPANLEDWIKQNTRTHKSHTKLSKYVDTKTQPKIKSFRTEIKGIRWLFGLPRRPIEFFWTFELALARFYTWWKYFLDITFFNKHYTDAWERVESTK